MFSRKSMKLTGRDDIQISISYEGIFKEFVFWPKPLLQNKLILMFV